MRQLALGIDVGTQSTKIVLLDAASRQVVARTARPHGLVGGLAPGASEQDPNMWIDAIHHAASALWETGKADPADVVAIGVSGQQHGLVVLDADAQAIRPVKLWNDTTCASEAAQLSRELGREIPPGFTAPKIRWLQDHEPAEWARVRHVMLPHDYVNFRLTGSIWTEPGDASGTGLFDPVARTWDRAVLDMIDGRLEHLLPPLVDSGTPAGQLSADGAVLLGCPAGLTVATGSGDNMMSAIGSGATRPGVVVVSLGTSGTVFSFSEDPVIDPEGLIAPFCDATGGWLPLLCTMNATGVVDEVVVALSDRHDNLAAAAQEVAPGADGLCLLPYFAGERVPNLPDATGVLIGIRPGLLRPPHLYRAALEGTSAVLGLGIARMERLGLAISSVRLVGGGARNPLWRQILADVLQVPVTTPAETESAAFGAAIQALWTMRRAAEPGLTAANIADEFVPVVGAPTIPDPETADVYGQLATRVADLTKTLFEQ